MDKKNLITTVNYRDLMLNKSALKNAAEQYKRDCKKMITAILNGLHLNGEVEVLLPVFDAESRRFDQKAIRGKLYICDNGGDMFNPCYVAFKSNEVDDCGFPRISKNFKLASGDGRDYIEFFKEDVLPRVKEFKETKNATVAAVGGTRLTIAQMLTAAAMI